jgi:hypothetical protein
MSRNAKDKVHRTIEDELVEALVKVNAIPQAHVDDMSKVCSMIKLKMNVTIGIYHIYIYMCVCVCK